MRAIELTVVYDNKAVCEGLRTAHGFACVLRDAGGTVLFDTGGSGQVLLENMRALGIDVGEIDAVVLSHMHWDHIGGLDALLAASPGATVHLPAAFSATFIGDLRARGVDVAEGRGTTQVTEHVWTTGALKRPLVEQALYVQTAAGITVVTGCAHPGVVRLVREAQGASGRPVDAVLGGFHMLHMGADEIARTVEGLKCLGVRRVGPCHCTGDAAREALRQAFGDGWLDVGVGARWGLPGPATAP